MFLNRSRPFLLRLPPYLSPFILILLVTDPGFYSSWYRSFVTMVYFQKSMMVQSAVRPGHPTTTAATHTLHLAHKPRLHLPEANSWLAVLRQRTRVRQGIISISWIREQFRGDFSLYGRPHSDASDDDDTSMVAWFRLQARTVPTVQLATYCNHAVTWYCTYSSRQLYSGVSTRRVSLVFFKNFPYFLVICIFWKISRPPRILKHSESSGKTREQQALLLRSR